MKFPERMEVVLLLNRLETVEKDGMTSAVFEVEGSREYQPKGVRLTITLKTDDAQRLSPDDLEHICRIQARADALSSMAEMLNRRGE